MSFKCTPENIVKNHENNPKATTDLIEYYANMKVRQEIDRLLKYSSITEVPSKEVVIIVSEKEQWHKFEGYDLFAGLDIKKLDV